MKKVMSMFLTMTVVFSLFGCGTNAPNVEITDDQKQESIMPTNPNELPPLPQVPNDGSIVFYYDDRITAADLGGTEMSGLQIVSQSVESMQVGTTQPDENVLIFDEPSGCYVAAGVGTAVVSVDGQEKLVRVMAAPISLFMITGHSLGAGKEGVKAQSVASEPDQVYSSYKTSTLQAAGNNMGIGYSSTDRPQGIDACCAGGGGTIGEGSALAWKWNQLTGEKVWVLNAAVGGSVIPEWHKDQLYYTPAVAMYRAAATVLKNEIAAGHYILRNTAIVYHSASNFVHKNVEYTNQIMEYWYDSMYNGFIEDLSMDITGDGQAETVQAIGFLPTWNSDVRGKYAFDQPINFYMAASDAYPKAFMAAETMRNWCSTELIRENFPTIEYVTQSEPVEMPIYKDDLLVEDGVHYTQVAYNAAGLEIATNLYAYLRSIPALESLTIYTSDGSVVKDELTLQRANDTVSLIAEATPCYVSNFTIEVSDNLKLISPFTVKAQSVGEGWIKISRNGELIRTILVEVLK